MSFPSNSYQRYAKTNQDKQTINVQKTILRNAEIPINSTAKLHNQQQHSASQRTQQNGTSSSTNHRDNQEAQSRANSHHHEPRLNKIAEMKKALEEIKLYEANTLENIQDLSKNSQELVNREVSSKLNFPMHQPIFKNLTKLDYGDARPDVARKLIQKSARKVAENVQKRKSLEIREEINQLINELVELEYVDGDEGFITPKATNFPGADDYLGLSKFSSPSFLIANRRTETQRFIDPVKDEALRDLFKSEEYLESRKWLQHEERPQTKSENSCQCLRDFYNQHSNCS